MSPSVSILYWSRTTTLTLTLTLVLTLNLHLESELPIPMLAKRTMTMMMTVHLADASRRHLCALGSVTHRSVTLSLW